MASVASHSGVRSCRPGSPGLGSFPKGKRYPRRLLSTLPWGTSGTRASESHSPFTEARGFLLCKFPRDVSLYVCVCLCKERERERDRACRNNFRFCQVKKAGSIWRQLRVVVSRLNRLAACLPKAVQPRERVNVRGHR